MEKILSAPAGSVSLCRKSEVFFKFAPSQLVPANFCLSSICSTTALTSIHPHSQPSMSLWCLHRFSLWYILRIGTTGVSSVSVRWKFKMGSGKGIQNMDKSMLISLNKAIFLGWALKNFLFPENQLIHVCVYRWIYVFFDIYTNTGRAHSHETRNACFWDPKNKPHLRHACQSLGFAHRHAQTQGGSMDARHGFLQKEASSFGPVALNVGATRRDTQGNNILAQCMDHACTCGKGIQTNVNVWGGHGELWK